MFISFIFVVIIFGMNEKIKGKCYEILKGLVFLIKEIYSDFEENVYCFK